MKNHKKKPLTLLLINDLVGKLYVALPNSIARKFHDNKEKIKRKEWGPIYLFGLRAAMCSHDQLFFSYVLIFFQ